MKKPLSGKVVCITGAGGSTPSPDDSAPSRIDHGATLYIQRLGKHALAGHDTATTNIVRAAVGENGYVVALGQEAECNGHASLASAHNSNFTHDFFLLRELRTPPQRRPDFSYSANLGMAGTPCSGPMAE